MRAASSGVAPTPHHPPPASPGFPGSPASGTWVSRLRTLRKIRTCYGRGARGSGSATWRPLPAPSEPQAGPGKAGGSPPKHTAFWVETVPPSPQLQFKRDVL